MVPLVSTDIKEAPVPVPLMVRLEDELHAKLAEHSRRTHAPMNRIVNDAIRLMFSGAIVQNSAGSGSSSAVATFGERIEHAQAALAALEVPQESLRDLQKAASEALRLVFSCTHAAMIAIDPSLTPIASPTLEAQSKPLSKEEAHA